ncbi:MAG: DUF192 domain-containing protein [Verrucomicrobiia bacterium]
MERVKVRFRGREVGEVEYSRSFWFRLKGLLGREGLAEGQGVLLAPCNSIHMWFMRFPIDAIFLDRDDRVVVIYESIRPWRMSGFHPSACKVLEFPAGTAARHGLVRGSVLELVSGSG